MLEKLGILGIIFFFLFSLACYVVFWWGAILLGLNLLRLAFGVGGTYSGALTGFIMTCVASIVAGCIKVSFSVNKED